MGFHKPLIRPAISGGTLAPDGFFMEKISEVGIKKKWRVKFQVPLPI